MPPRLVSSLAVLCLVAFAAGCGGLRFVIDAVPARDDLTESTVEPGSSSAKVALIDVSGLLVDAEVGVGLQRRENPVARFSEALRKAERDRRVKAVIVRVNSPGGTVAASDVMYRELRHFREHSGKPVVVLMAGVAASGGFYLSCAGDEVIAHPSTVTGSIGVIMQTFNFAEGMQRIGIRADAITSGPNKAVGSPFQPMPPEHRALLQGIVNEFYAQFLAVVRERRPGLAEPDLARVTDGRVLTGTTAREAGLVDAVGDLRTALAAARCRADAPTARLVKYHRPLEHVASPYAETPAAGMQVNLFQLNVDAASMPAPAFCYLWDPMAWSSP